MTVKDQLYRWIGRGAVRDAVVVAGSPRSGTTWLAELLGAMPSYKVLDEPLHLQFPTLPDLGLDWRTYVAPDADRPDLAGYLERAFRGQIRGNYLTMSDSRLGRFVELVRRPHVVAKFVRANRMLHWIDATFDLRGIVLLVRHPCAVVASQLDYEHAQTNAWAQATPSNDVEVDLAGSLPDGLVDRFGDRLRRLETREEVLAALWAVDTYCALRLHGDAPGPVVTYEDLVASPHDTLRTLFASLGISLPDTVFRQIDLPSESAASDLHRQDVNRQLSKWQRKLTDEQVDRILSVTHRFDLDMYSEHQRPHVHED